MADPGYLLTAYNFRVDLDGATLAFAEVSGLAAKFETATYRHGLSFLEGEELTKFAWDEFVPLTFKRGTAQGARELVDWLGEKDPRALVVSLCDADGVPVVGWKVARAVPVKLSAPAFDAASNEVSIDSLEVQAAGISVEHF